MADRHGDAAQPFSSAQDRVFDGGGGSSSSHGPAFDSSFDHGSYMALLAAGINPLSTLPPPPPWAIEDMTAAPATNPPPFFPLETYGLSYQQPPSLAAPMASNLHSYPCLHTEPPQWPLQPTSFTLHMTPHEQTQQHFGGGGALGIGNAQAAQVVFEQPARDGYNWRKYGQKQLKDAESPRSYYKCTKEGCPVKKIVERSSDGNIKEITYKGRHSHPRPREFRRDEVGGAEENAEPSDAQEGSGGGEAALLDNDAGIGHERNADAEAVQSGSQRVVKKSKIIIQTPSEVDLLDDGFRWRKYGQKAVKGNPRPRSYYKCTTVNCNVRKQIERASSDPKFVLTTYTGRHNHDPPGRTSDGEAATTDTTLQHNAPNASSSASQMTVTINSDNYVQRSSGVLRLKEEDNRD